MMMMTMMRTRMTTGVEEAAISEGAGRHAAPHGIAGLRLELVGDRGCCSSTGIVTRTTAGWCGIVARQRKERCVGFRTYLDQRLKTRIARLGMC